MTRGYEMKEELRLIKQAIGTLQRAVAILEDRLNVDTAEKQSKFRPPTKPEAATYYEDKGYHFDFEKWYGHYKSNGWKVGKNPMKDWHAAMVTWESGWRAEHPTVEKVRLDASGRPLKANGQERLL